MQAFEINAPELDQLPQALRDAETILVMPSTDMAAARQAARLMVQRSRHDAGLLLLAYDLHSEGFVAVANRCFKATRSRYFGYVAQDAFAGRKWLQKALKTLESSQKGLLGFNDGKWSGMLASFGLGRRDWLSRNYPGGELFCPEYRRHYADTEITALAMGNQEYCYDPNAVLIEVDWTKDSRPVNADDKALFAQRKQQWLPSRLQHTQILEMFN